MRDLTALRRRFITLAAVLAVVAAACGIFLVTPYGRSRERLQEDYARLRTELQQKRSELGPLANIDQRLVTARQQIQGFYQERLPEQYSAISAKLAKLAQQNGVKVGQVRYDLEKEQAAPGARGVKIDASVTGNYVNVVKFINALERDQMFFVPESVQLAEGQGGVTLQLTVQTFLREGAQA